MKSGKELREINKKWDVAVEELKHAIEDFEYKFDFDQATPTIEDFVNIMDKLVTIIDDSKVKEGE